MTRQLCFWAFVLAALPAAAQPGQMIQSPGQPATEPYADAPSGITFPVTAGVFKRFRVTRGPGQQDINAGYIDPDPAARLSATVFVERLPQSGELCSAMADIEHKVTLKAHPDATFSDLIAPVAPGYSAIAFAGHYAESLGGAAELYFYCADGSPLMVEYSFHHIAARDVAPLEADFLHELNLPEKH